LRKNWWEAKIEVPNGRRMNNDEYVRSIIRKYALLSAPTPEGAAAAQAVYPIIQQWAGEHLLKVSYSGSTAKGTAISGITDVDLFISLSNETPENLGEIYRKLATKFENAGYTVRRQNVSIGITHNGVSMDLVPARKHPGNTSDHSLYRSKAKTWTQTNVDTHIRVVSQSGRLDEIRAIKIWRALHGLEFTSFYLEMTVINALYGKKSGQVATNFAAVLEYLRDSFERAAVTDQANANNTISDDLSVAEKRAVASAAGACLQHNWNQVLW